MDESVVGELLVELLHLKTKYRNPTFSVEELTEILRHFEKTLVAMEVPIEIKVPMHVEGISDQCPGAVYTTLYGDSDDATIYLVYTEIADTPALYVEELCASGDKKYSRANRPLFDCEPEYLRAAFEAIEQVFEEARARIELDEEVSDQCDE